MHALDRIQEHMAATSLPRTAEPWKDYALTVRRGNKIYPVGTLTVYDNGAPSLVMAHHNVHRLQVTTKAWGRVLDSFGYSTDRLERYAARSLAFDQRGDEF